MRIFQRGSDEKLIRFVYLSFDSFALLGEKLHGFYLKFQHKRLLGDSLKRLYFRSSGV